MRSADALTRILPEALPLFMSLVFPRTRALAVQVYLPAELPDTWNVIVLGLASLAKVQVILLSWMRQPSASITHASGVEEVCMHHSFNIECFDEQLITLKYRSPSRQRSPPKAHTNATCWFA